MDLSAKFQAVASGTVVQIGALPFNTRLPVKFSQRFVTKYGPSFLLTLRENDQNVKIILQNW